MDSELAVSLLSLYIDGVSGWIIDEFESNGIGVILIKGPAFARLLYDRPSERVYSDTDLLVQERDRERAAQLLVQGGFERVDRDVDWVGPAPKYAHSYERPDGAMVDLHWRLSGATVASDRIWHALSEHIVQMEVGGRSAGVLDAPATAMLVALHNAHHGTGRSTTATDLERAIERLDLEVWQSARTLADEVGAGDVFAAGLRLSETGNALADQIGVDRATLVEVWLKSNPSSYGAWMLDRFHQTSSLGGKVKIFFQVAAPAPSVMKTFFPLAQRGRLGLIAAYVLRPLRLIAHAGPAVSDWVRARRALRTHHDDVRAGG